MSSTASSLSVKYLMRYHELNEGRSAPLYHWMDDIKASRTFKADALKPLFAHKIVGNEQGISLTRNRHYKHFNGMAACLVFDRQKLAYHYRIIPLDAERAAAYDRGLRSDNRHDRGNKPGDEMAEEYVVGTIKPLHRYLSGIIIGDHNDYAFVTPALVYARHFNIPVSVTHDAEIFWDNYRDEVEAAYQKSPLRKKQTK